MHIVVNGLFFVHIFCSLSVVFRFILSLALHRTLAWLILLDLHKLHHHYYCPCPNVPPLNLSSFAGRRRNTATDRHYLHSWIYIDVRANSPIYSKIFRDPPKSHEDWLRIVQEQEQLHNAEMGKWQSVLQIAVDLLRKVSVVCKKIVKNAKVDQLDLMGDDEDDDESLFSAADELLRHKEF